MPKEGEEEGEEAEEEEESEDDSERIVLVSALRELRLPSFKDDKRGGRGGGKEIVCLLSLLFLDLRRRDNTEEVEEVEEVEASVEDM